MRFRTAIVLASVLSLLAPSFVSAAFVDASVAAKAQVSSLSQQQLDSLNSKVFTDAHLAGKIIGFDRSEIGQLKANIRALQYENAQLRGQTAEAPVSLLEGRVAALEASFSTLQTTLITIVQMLTSLLAKLQ